MLPSNENRRQKRFYLSYWLLFLYHLIILILIYICFERLKIKQERFIEYFNRTIRNDVDDYYHHHHQQHYSDCSCQNFLYPKINETTHCLDIYVGLNERFSNVFCLNQNQSQWLLIQNRQSNNINFNRTWMEYRHGFGQIINRTNFWIGNENLYWLTNHYHCRLKIELINRYNETRRAFYETFRVGNQNDDYRLYIDNYHGDIEGSNTIDSFSRWHQNVPFSTYDHYITADNLNCPQIHGGVGWWYHSGPDCAHVQLNGLVAGYLDGLVPFNQGIIWFGWKTNRHYSFQSVQMFIQPKFKITSI